MRDIFSMTFVAGACIVLGPACAVTPPPEIPPPPESVVIAQLAGDLRSKVEAACPDGRFRSLRLAPSQSSRFADFTIDGFLILVPAEIRCADEGIALDIDPVLYRLIATGRSTPFQLVDFERIQSGTRCTSGEKTVDFQLISSDKGVGTILSYPQTPGGRITAGTPRRFSFIRLLACDG